MATRCWPPDSLLAWLPARCSAGQNCPLRITDTATLSTKTVRSPLHHGFAVGAAFSPDGKQLAVFANGNLLGTGAVRLAMVTTGTGTLRLVGSMRLAIGEDRAWALWLPDGRHLITGGIEASYAVSAATLSARPLFFIHVRDHYIETSQDINYSAVLIPPRR
jgi:WD40 repeat protein